MRSQLSLFKPVILPEKWLPVVLLLLAGLTIFLTERTDGGSIDGSIGSETSAHGMTLSKNLINSEHFLFGFSKKELQNGKVVYDAYNRFPVFPFLLTGLLINSFDNNLSFQVYIARQLMNLFFFITLIVVYKLIELLVERKFLALSLTLIIFSSYYLLSYKDLIFNDMPALLGFATALYGAVKSQKQKLKIHEILFYSIIPVSLGWQPFAVLAAWTFVDALELLKRGKPSLGTRISKFVKQPSLVIFGMAILWGSLLLGFQLLNEWRIVGGSFFNLPSVTSSLWRSGLSSAVGHTNIIESLDWLTYLPGQFHSIIIMLIPFWPVFQIEPGYNAPIFIVMIFIVYIFIKSFKTTDLNIKSVLIMTLSGFFWTIPMKNFVALHDYQTIYYLGFSISIYLLLFYKFNIKSWGLLAINIALFFMISVMLTNYYKAPFLSNKVAQFQNIYNVLPPNSRVYFEGELKGNTRHIELILADCIFTKKEEADYIITQNTDTMDTKLTSNSNFNLFKVYHRQQLAN